MKPISRAVPAQVITILFLLQGVAFAAIDSSTSPSAPVSTTKTEAEKIAELKSLVSGHLRVGLSFNAASKLDGINFKQNGTTLATANANLDNTPALELTWANRLYDGGDKTKFDWFVGMTIERERTLSTFNLREVGGGPGSTSLNLANDYRPTFHANLLSAGVRWTPTSMIYVPIGFTYGFRSDAKMPKGGSFELDPIVGLLAGAGLRLAPTFEIEAVYKIVRYNMTIRDSNFATNGQELAGTAEMSGATVGARYIF